MVKTHSCWCDEHVTPERVKDKTVEVIRVELRRGSRCEASGCREEASIWVCEDHECLHERIVRPPHHFMHTSEATYWDEARLNAILDAVCIASKDVCVLHHPQLDCNCTDTPDWAHVRQNIVGARIEQYVLDHDQVPPHELVDRWLGKWR